MDTKCLIQGLLLTLCLCTTEVKAEKVRPNVLLIAVDDLRPEIQIFDLKQW